MGRPRGGDCARRDVRQPACCGGRHARLQAAAAELRSIRRGLLFAILCLLAKEHGSKCQDMKLVFKRQCCVSVITGTEGTGCHVAQLIVRVGVALRFDGDCCGVINSLFQ